MTHVGVAKMEHWTVGDYGGAFAGAVGLVVAGAKGLAWVLNWEGTRSDAREAKLRAWEASLQVREHAYRQDLEAKFAALERRTGALTVAAIDLTLALSSKDPHNPALRRAASALRSAFPIQDGLPAGIAELLVRLDALGDAP